MQDPLLYSQIPSSETLIINNKLENSGGGLQGVDLENGRSFPGGGFIIKGAAQSSFFKCHVSSLLLCDFFLFRSLQMFGL